MSFISNIFLFFLADALVAMEKAMKRDKIEVNDRQVRVKCLYSSFSCFEAQWKTIFLDEDRILFRAFMGFSLCIVIGGGEANRLWLVRMRFARFTPS